MIPETNAVSVCKNIPEREAEFLFQKMVIGDADTDFAKPDGTGFLILVQLADSRFQVCAKV